MAPQLAWIGLGNMGRESCKAGICKNLVQKGNLSQDLIICNRTAQRAHDLSSKIGHSKVAISVSEAASAADIIFYCLGDDAAVESTVDEILKGNVKGKVLVDCSTIHPDNTTKECKKIEAAGAHFVACPVFGAPAMADAGQLVCILAGKSEAVEKVKPYCKGVMGREVIDFSRQEPAKATLLKVIGNTFIMSMVETLAEGHVVAEKTGLGVEQLHKFIETLLPGPITAYSVRMKSGDYYQREPLFAVDLAIKDCAHAQSLAQSAGVTMKNVQLADGLLKGVKDHMGGTKGDIAGMYGAKRKESGLRFENQV